MHPAQMSATWLSSRGSGRCCSGFSGLGQARGGSGDLILFALRSHCRLPQPLFSAGSADVRPRDRRMGWRPQNRNLRGGTEGDRVLRSRSHLVWIERHLYATAKEDQGTILHDFQPIGIQHAVGKLQLHRAFGNDVAVCHINTDKSPSKPEVELRVIWSFSLNKSPLVS